MSGIRSELQFSLFENSSQVSMNSNLSSIQLVIFCCIHDRFLSCKLLLDVWMKTISRVPSHAGHKYINIFYGLNLLYWPSIFIFFYFLIDFDSNFQADNKYL